MHRVQTDVDLRLLDTFDEVLAVFRTLRFREFGDGCFAHRFGFLVVVEIGAVAAVVLVLVHQVAGNQRSDFGGKRIVFVLCLQVFHRGLVLLILLQNGIDEAITLEVIVNQHIFVLLLEIKGDEFLVDFQTFVDWVVSSAQVGLHEILGGQPPFFGVAFGLVGVGFTLIVIGHAVEHELEQ